MVHRQKPRKKYSERFAEKQTKKREHVAPAAMQSVGNEWTQMKAQRFLRDIGIPDRLTALVRDGMTEEQLEELVRRYSKFNTKKLTRGKHIGGSGTLSCGL